MRRWIVSAATLVMVALVAAFVYFVWLNSKLTYGLELRTGDEPIPVTMGMLLGGSFVFGVAIGIVAAVLTFTTWRWEWLATIERLSADNRRLGAANRALEAALPVLREGFDEAIGGLDPHRNALNTPVVEVDSEAAAAVRIEQLALEDATARLEARRRSARGESQA